MFRFNEWWKEARKYAKKAWVFVAAPNELDFGVEFDEWWTSNGPAIESDDESDDEDQSVKLREVAHAAWDAAVESLF